MPRLSLLFSIAMIGFSLSCSRPAPAQTDLIPNTNNPVIRFGDHEAMVRLTVHDLREQAIRTLVERIQRPGQFSAVWNGRDTRGERLGSGIYFYRLRVGDELPITRKMVMVK